MPPVLVGGNYHNVGEKCLCPIPLVLVLYEYNVCVLLHHPITLSLLVDPLLNLLVNREGLS